MYGLATGVGGCCELHGQPSLQVTRSMWRLRSVFPELRSAWPRLRDAWPTDCFVSQGSQRRCLHCSVSLAGIHTAQALASVSLDASGSAAGKHVRKERGGSAAAERASTAARGAANAAGKRAGTVLLVESPAKAKKIQTYLGADYKVTPVSKAVSVSRGRAFIVVLVAYTRRLCQGSMGQ